MACYLQLLFTGSPSHAKASDAHETLVSARIENSPVAPLVIGHSLGGMVASAYSAIFPSRAVINIDQPLRLAAFKDGLGQLEPLLRGDQASFEMAIGLAFGSMFGPLSPDEVTRLNELRRADQNVVLGIWGTVFDSSPEELDATVELWPNHGHYPHLVDSARFLKRVRSFDPAI